MILCPFWGEWCDDYEQINNGCCLQGNNQSIAVDRTIIDEWNTIPIPPASPLRPVVMEPQTSALLILDMETSICKNPRCLASLEKIYPLLIKARSKGMLVVYSLTYTGNSAAIFRKIAPGPAEPIVRSYVDKFYQTDLEKILQAHGIKTLLITGYATNGAVLHTATAAAIRGYRVIIPVDCMSATIAYAEQYTAWHMLNSPGTRDMATLTKTGWVSLQ